METIPVDEPVTLQATPEWRSPPKGRWIVVWYRQALPSIARDNPQPLVNIAFRNLDALTRLGDGQGEFLRVDRPVTELGQLRLGTIVHDGRVTERVKLESTRDFCVEFPEAGSCLRELTRLEVPTGHLPGWFAGVSLGGYALALAPSGRACLWIPCMEFLSRFYGRSQEIKRALLAYPWKWATECLILSEPPVPPPAANPVEWRVQFGWGRSRLVPKDAVFLARLRHSQRAQCCARRLYEQMEAAHPTIASGQHDGVHLEVEPWFSGPAELRVSGFPLPDGGFLALRLDGGTEPAGPRVVRESGRRARDRPGGPGAAAVPPSKFRPRLLEVAREKPPDRETFHIPLPDPPFEVLGVPQTVDVVMSESFDGGSGPSSPPGDGEAVGSTAEPSGSGKGIQSAVVGAPLRGTLWGVWDALRDFRKSDPRPSLVPPLAGLRLLQVPAPDVDAGAVVRPSA